MRMAIGLCGLLVSIATGAMAQDFSQNYSTTFFSTVGPFSQSAVAPDSSNDFVGLGRRNPVGSSATLTTGFYLPLSSFASAGQIQQLQSAIGQANSGIAAANATATAANAAAATANAAAAAASASAAAANASAAAANAGVAAANVRIDQVFQQIQQTQLAVAQIQSAITQADRGVAAVAAMANISMPSAPGRTTWSLNGSAFQSEFGGGFSIAHRLNVSTPLAFTAGYGNGGGTAHVGRVGLMGEF